VSPQETPPRGTVAAAGEFGLIQAVTQGRKQPAATLLGPGDDAAVVAAPDGRIVATTDVLVQGVHFRFDWSTPELVGRKAIAVNLADVAAMGATPTSVLIGLACPSDTETAVIMELTEGMWAEAARAGAGIVGGDMVRADQLVISVTALGRAAGRRGSYLWPDGLGGRRARGAGPRVPFAGRCGQRAALPGTAVRSGSEGG
jgi:thiamine-monophosphate kinase